MGTKGLLVEARGHLCGIPIASVIETMRPQPVTPVPGAPPYVLGLAVIRATVTPVIDLARRLSWGEQEPARYITARAGSHAVALAAERVLGVEELQDAASSEGAPGDAVERVLLWRGQVVMVLHPELLVGPDVWARLAVEATP